MRLGETANDPRKKLTRSNCLQANSSRVFVGRRSMTGRDMLWMLDSTISAPYCVHQDKHQNQRSHNKAVARTFTTRELFFPCSYTRIAVLTSGRVETRETNCALGEATFAARSSSACDESTSDTVDGGAGGDVGFDDSGAVSCILWLRMSPSARIAIITLSSASSIPGPCFSGCLEPEA